MLFQHLGPATEKARSPKPVLDFRTCRSPFASDLKEGPALVEDTLTQYSARYPGAAQCRDLYTSSYSLCSFRYRTGSQCNTSRRNGVTRSYFLRLHTSLAAEFSILPIEVDPGGLWVPPPVGYCSGRPEC